MASYSSSLSVALTYLKEGPNSVACVCLTSPGLLCVIRIIITPLHNTVKKNKKHSYSWQQKRQTFSSPLHPCAISDPYKTVYSIDPISRY